MKLLRVGAKGAEKPAILDAAGRARDLSGVLPEITAQALQPASLARLRALDPETLPLLPDGARIGLPWTGCGKFICVGLNYADHAAEAGLPAPAEPVLFMKATSALSGPTDAVRIPPGALKTDWEVELGIVIGTRVQQVAEADALVHVAGYVLANDVSERSYQMERGGQWDKGKGCDTFAPVGPWLVTTDEIPDPHAIGLWLEVNGQRMQDGHTRNFIFGVPRVLAYISQFMTLEPGDLVLTGTPAGVGLGQKPTPRFLRAGDVMRLGATGLGEQRLVCTGG